MSKVFVINKGNYNYSDALQYGELIFLSQDFIDKTSPEKLYETYSELLKDSTEDDFLIITGLQIMNAVASSILAQKHGKVNYLIFSNGRYLHKPVVYDG